MTETDPRIHGPDACPRPCAECADARHHWTEAGFDPQADPDDLDPDELLVLRYDRLHGTGHARCYYACKHCGAWAEAEYVFDLEEAAAAALDDDGDEDDDEHMTCWCGAAGPHADLCDDSGLDDSCGGSRVLYCHCGGDFCVCHHHGEIECPGCPDCEGDDDEEVDYDGPGHAHDDDPLGPTFPGGWS